MRYFLQASTPACAARPARRVRVPPASKAANTAPLCAWRDALCRKCGALALGPLAAGALLAALPLPAAAAAELPYSGGQGDLFEPARYVGRWYEVASEKRGFAGEGQADCHCTQGIYVARPDPQRRFFIALEVNTFCVHGGPKGRLSGIQGRVTCADPALLRVLPEFESPLERAEMVVAKCVLTFPSLPFILPEPYDVLRTDYDSYALVQGAADRSFVQIYSRTPNPGPAFLAARRAELVELGYDLAGIKDTPQDCPEFPVPALMERMKEGGAPAAGAAPGAAMRGQDLGPVAGVRFAAPRSAVQSIKNFLQRLAPGS